MHNIEGCETANDALRSGQENPGDFPGMGIRRSTEQQLKEMIYILADISDLCRVDPAYPATEAGYADQSVKIEKYMFGE